MKTFLLILISLNCCLFSQWQEIERPQSRQALNNIKTGSDFIVGSLFNPYFSFDGGETWEKRISGLPEERGAIDKIVVEEDIVYILLSQTTSIRTQHIMYSTDKGLNWKKIIDSITFDNHNIISDFDVYKNNVYLLPYNGKIVLKSTNFGGVWDTLPQWDAKFGSMQLIKVKNDSIVLASIGDSDVIIISIDSGNIWKATNNGVSTNRIKCLNIHNNTIYTGGQNGFYYSEDFGQSWKSPGTLVVGSIINDIEIIKDTVYLATENGLYRAKDLFKGWEEIDFFKTKRVWEIHYGIEKLFLRSLNRDYSEDKSFVSEINNSNDFSELNFLSESSLNSTIIDYPRIFFATDKIFKKEQLFSEDKILFQTDTVYEVTRLSVYENNIINLYKLTSPILSNNIFNYSEDNGQTWKKFEIEVESNNFNIINLFLLNNDTLLIIDRNKGAFLSVGFSKDINQIKSDNVEIDELLSNVHKIFRRNNTIYYFGHGVILESDTNLTNWKSYSKNLTSNDINDLSKSKNSIYIIQHTGGYLEPKNVRILVSRDEGNSWKVINNLFPNSENTLFLRVFNFENYVFVSSTNGVFFSKDNGENWEELNDGLSSLARGNRGEFLLYSDKILFCSSSGIFHRNLDELGITLSTEKTETRNYLYTFPPYPQPTNNIVKIDTYWDSALPFTEKDIEVYDLTGVKIKTENTLSIQKETNYNGKIIWDASTQQPGIYILKINHGTETRIRKIMVVE